MYPGFLFSLGISNSFPARKATIPDLRKETQFSEKILVNGDACWTR